MNTTGKRKNGNHGSKATTDKDITLATVIANLITALILLPHSPIREAEAISAGQGNLPE